MKKRLVSLIIAASMTLGTVPTTAFAEGEAPENTAYITSFAELAEEVKTQEIIKGSDEEPTLPTKIKGTLTTTTWERLLQTQPPAGSGDGSGDSSSQPAVPPTDPDAGDGDGNSSQPTVPPTDPDAGDGDGNSSQPTVPPTDPDAGDGDGNSSQPNNPPSDPDTGDSDGNSSQATAPPADPPEDNGGIAAAIFSPFFIKAYASDGSSSQPNDPPSDPDADHGSSTPPTTPPSGDGENGDAPENNNDYTGYQANVEAVEVEVEVVWTISDEAVFSTDKIATYTYTAELADAVHELAAGIDLPVITVNVVSNLPESGVVASFTPFTEAQLYKVYSLDTTEDEILSELPREVEVVLEGIDEAVMLPVTWKADYEFVENSYGAYIYTAVLPDGFTASEGVSLPEIYVMMGEVMNMSTLAGTWQDPALFGEGFAFAGGSGTLNDPWQIETPEQLAYIEIYEDSTDYYVHDYYVLKNDIDLAGKAWIPLTESISELDGAGNSIQNMQLTSDDPTTATMKDIGFFGTLQGDIRDINFENVNINIATSGDATDTVGTVVGYMSNNSSITNVVIESGTINSNAVHTGGAVGETYFDTNLTSVTNKVDITASGNVGGIIGYPASVSTLINSVVNEGDITANISETSYIGGIAADGNSATIINSVNTGLIDVNIIHSADPAYLTAYVGGISGDYNTITNSYSTTAIHFTYNGDNAPDSATVSVYVGGISSGSYSGSNLVQNTYNKTNITYGNFPVDGTSIYEYAIAKETREGSTSNYWLDADLKPYNNVTEHNVEDITSHATFNADGELTPYSIDTHTHTIIGGSTDLLSALNEYVEQNIGENQSLSTWGGTSSAPNFAPAAALSGVVSDEDGAVSGVIVALYDSAGTVVGKTATNASGEYTFSTKVPGTYQLYVEKEGKLRTTKLIDFPVTEGSGAGNIKMITLVPFDDNEISSIGELAYFSEQVSTYEQVYDNDIKDYLIYGDNYEGETVTLTANLDLTGYNFTPIGDGKTYGNLFDNNIPFAGSFNGNNKTITGLNIGSISENVGLFAEAGHGYSYSTVDTIYDLTLDSPVIKGRGKSSAHVGSLVGKLQNNIDVRNVTVINPTVDGAGAVGGIIGGGSSLNEVRNVEVVGGSVTNIGYSNSNQAGGIVGSSVTSIDNATNSATVISAESAGGILGGYADKITNCTNTGDISSDYDSFISSRSGDAAGIAINGQGAIISGNTNTGTITAPLGNAAGITTSASYSSKIFNNKNSGDIISSGANIGGIVAKADGNSNRSPVEIYNNINTGDIEYSSEKENGTIGGILGYAWSYHGEVLVYNNYNTGDLVNTSTHDYGKNASFGGISGSGGALNNNYSSGALPTPFIDPKGRISDKNVGGLMGSVESLNDSVKNSYFFSQTYTYEGENDFDGIGNTYHHSGDIVYSGSGSFVSGGALTAAAGHTISANTLLEALNINAMAITGARPWEAGTGAGADSYPVFAAPVTLSGSISGSDTAMLVDATVNLRDASSNDIIKTTTTDTSGNYSITEIIQGNYTLEITKDGYMPVRISNPVNATSIKNVKILKYEAIPESKVITTAGQLATLAKYAFDGEYITEFTNSDPSNAYSNYVAEHSYTLGATIDLSDYYWTPIGTEENPFSGDFDGKGNTITGLTIDNNDDYQGLFGYTSAIYNQRSYGIAYNDIKNINLTNVNIEANHYVGALAGYVKGTQIDSVNVSSATLTGEHAVGGMAGMLSQYSSTRGASVNVLNSNVNAAVTATNGTAGGFAGRAYAQNGYGGGGYNPTTNSVNITDSTMKGSVSGTYAGGFLGHLSNSYLPHDGTSETTESGASMTNLVNEATVTGLISAGGIYGYVYDRYYFDDDEIINQVLSINCENKGAVTANNTNVSGSLGATAYGIGGNIVFNSKNTAPVTATAPAGTASAYGIALDRVYNSYNSSTVTATSKNTATAYIISRPDESTENSNDSGARIVYGDENTELPTTNYYLTSALGSAQTVSYDEAITTPEALQIALNDWVNTYKTEDLNNSLISMNALANWQNNPTAGGYPIYAIPATVTYHANGATSGTVPVYSGPQEYTGGEHVILANSGNLAKTNAILGGWSTSPTDTTNVYAVGEKVPLTSSAVNLYAVWGMDISDADVRVTETYTYNGTAQTIDYAVYANGALLTKDTHYTVESIHLKGTTTNLSSITDAGSYEITLKGKGIYTGEHTFDLVTVNQQLLTVTRDSYGALTKMYDSTVNPPTAFDATIATNKAGYTVDVDSLSNYERADVDYDYNQITLTFGDINVPSGEKASNYKISSNTLTLTGEITPYLIKSVGAGTVKVTKTFDKTTSPGATTGALTPLGEANATTPTDDVIVNFTIGNYDSANVGSGITLTVTPTTLGGSGAANYALDLTEASTTLAVGIITAAPYQVNISPQTPSIKAGSDVQDVKDAITVSTVGVEGEEPIGSIVYYTDTSRETVLNDAFMQAVRAGDTETIYWTYTLNSSPINANYNTTPREGSFVMSIVDGDPQIVTFADTSLVRTYGDGAFTNTVTVKVNNSPVDASARTRYTSSVPSVATVDASSGEVTIVGAGSTVITATVSAVPGEYVAGSGNYALTVNEKDISITMNNAEREFGKANPSFTFTVDDPTLFVAGDDEDDLAITPSTTAVATSNVGNYPITAVSGATNYNVTINDGTLSVTKTAHTNAATDKLVKFSMTDEQAVDLTAYIPTDAGTISKIEVAETDALNIVGTVSGDIANKQAKFTLESLTEANVGNTATLKATITTGNYNDIVVTINLSVVAKDIQTNFAFMVADKTVSYGDVDFTETASGQVEGSTVSYESSNTDVATVNATTGVVTIKGAGNTTITATASDTVDYAQATDSYSLTVQQVPLELKAESLAIYLGESVPSTFEITYTGFITGEDSSVLGANAYTASTAADGSTAGNFIIEIAGTTANVNYAISMVNGELTVLAPVTSPTLPDPIPDDIDVSDPVLHVPDDVVLEREDGYQVAPDTAKLSVTSGVSTVQSDKLTEEAPENAIRTVFLEISLVDGSGNKLQPNGMIEIFIPYEDLADLTQSSNIRVLHLRDDGSFETLTPIRLLNGIKFEVSSLSPFMIYEVERASTSSGGSGGGSSYDPVMEEYEFWEAVKEAVRAAEDGDTITVKAEDYDRMPWTAMELLNEYHVNLIIQWDGGEDVLIPAGEAQEKVYGRIYWPLSKLVELYDGASIDEDAMPEEAPEQVNPQTGGTLPSGGAHHIVAAVSTPVTQPTSENGTSEEVEEVTPPTAGFEASAYIGTQDAIIALEEQSDSRMQLIINSIAIGIIAISAAGAFFYSKHKKLPKVD